MRGRAGALFLHARERAKKARRMSGGREITSPRASPAMKLFSITRESEEISSSPLTRAYAHELTLREKTRRRWEGGERKLGRKREGEEEEEACTPTSPHDRNNFCHGRRSKHASSCSGNFPLREARECEAERKEKKGRRRGEKLLQRGRGGKACVTEIYSIIPEKGGEERIFLLLLLALTCAGEDGETRVGLEREV